MSHEHLPTKEISMPVVDARNKVRLGNLSTMKNATKPVENNDQRAKTALMSVCVLSALYPIESRIKVR